MAAVSTRTFPEAFSKSVLLYQSSPRPHLPEGELGICWFCSSPWTPGLKGGRAGWTPASVGWLWVSVLSFHIPVQSVRRATPQSSGMSPCTFRGLWGLTSRNTSLQKECAVNKDNPDGSFSELTDHIQCLFVVLSRPKPVTFPLSLETPARSLCN